MMNHAEVIREALTSLCAYEELAHAAVFRGKVALASLATLTREATERNDQRDPWMRHALNGQATIVAQAERIKALEEAGRIVLAMNTDLVDAQLVISAAINPKDYDTGTREAVLGKELAAALAPKEAQG